MPSNPPKKKSGRTATGKKALAKKQHASPKKTRSKPKAKPKAASSKLQAEIKLPTCLASKSRSKALMLKQDLTYNGRPLKNNFHSWMTFAFGKDYHRWSTSEVINHQKNLYTGVAKPVSNAVASHGDTAPFSRSPHGNPVISQIISNEFQDLEELLSQPDDIKPEHTTVTDTTYLSPTRHDTIPAVTHHTPDLLSELLDMDFLQASPVKDLSPEIASEDAFPVMFPSSSTGLLNVAPPAVVNSGLESENSTNNMMPNDLRLTGGHHVCTGTEAWFGTGFNWDTKVEACNKDVFGNESFRYPQRAAINSILSNKDTLVLFPTGGGKSLIYQIPSVISNGFTVVVMPLLALMQDQRCHLKEKGIRAEMLTGNTSNSELKRIAGLVRDADIDVLFVTPEKFSASEWFMNLLSSVVDRISLFVIDEAHCISQWGNDFRPDYRRLCRLRKAFPSVPILALTASATVESIQDICHQLHLREANVFRKSFDRSNIKYVVKARPSAGIEAVLFEILGILKSGDTGIIYCLTRNECASVADKLKKVGIPCGYYHAGLSAKERDRVQTQWMRDDLKVMIATIAFGLGIDKPNVRYVIHLTLPKSIENYFQESGRAGRDGLQSTSYLYYHFGDKVRHQRLQTGSNGASRALNEMLEFCSDTRTCRRKLLLKYFGETFEEARCILKCDNCERKLNNSTRVINCGNFAKCILDFVTSTSIRRSGKWCPGLTCADLRNLLTGKKIKKQEFFATALKDTQLFGLLKNHFSENIVQKLLQTMLSRRVLGEKTVKLPNRGVTSYIYPGINSFSAATIELELEGQADEGLCEPEKTAAGAECEDFNIDWVAYERRNIAI